jgi:hypothetical protein
MSQAHMAQQAAAQVTSLGVPSGSNLKINTVLADFLHFPVPVNISVGSGSPGIIHQFNSNNTRPLRYLFD